MVRILVLHGFAQNPEEVASKSRQIQACLSEAAFVFPSAAIELVSFDGDIEDRKRPTKESPARFSWNYPDEDMSSNLFNLKVTLARLIPILEQDGPFDGIMGFSQGAAVASAVTSLLEKRTIRINHPELKFAILFCGARPASTEFNSIYEDIRTPSLHLVGKMDVMVPLDRSLQLAASFAQATIAFHPGNHFIPQGCQFTRMVVDFIRSHTLVATCNLRENLLSANLVRSDSLSATSLPSLYPEQRKDRKIRLIRRPSGHKVQMLVS